MEPEQAPKSRAIFDHAVTIASAQDQLAYVNDACVGHPELRDRVQALLNAHAAAGIFLEAPAIHVEPGQAVDMSKGPIPFEQPGAVIDRFKLLEKIGEGGMGVVFMAEQTHPVRRRVALKLIKPGMDSGQVIARFEAERQALAMMDHPNIAKVLEAGMTDAGRPYFVMELVRGIPITEYCDQNHLSARDRLGLFMQVCHAVQHAHQKGIIHRDLKPNNVLVTLHDSAPVPKVIDFGIAKATAGQRLSDHTFFTEFRQLIGSPLYMSPEQAQLSGLDVDTRSDVYSLGVLLYELLTGTTPFDKQRLNSAAQDEVRRIIREEEPPQPSTRISDLGVTGTTASALRATDPRRLCQLLRGDLDWIVMRALEKDRTRRYDTANGLARDVERYLHDEPVEACPPSRIYRLRKYVRRNKAAVTTTALIAAVLLIATAISTRQAVIATRAKTAAQIAERQVAAERDHALAETRRADEQTDVATAVNGFLGDILSSTVPWQRLGDDVTVLQAIQAAVKKLDAGALDGKPLVEAAVRISMADALQRLLHGEEAEPNLRKALELRRAHLPPGHLDIAAALSKLGGLSNDLGFYKKAEVLDREAIAILQNALPAEDLPYTYDLVDLGRSLRLQGKLADAEALDRQAVEILRRDIPAPDWRIGHALLAVSRDLRTRHDYADAESLSRQAIEMYRNNFGPSNPQYRTGLLDLADALKGEQKFAEADAIFAELRNTWDPDDVLHKARILRSGAALLKAEGNLSEALSQARQSLDFFVGALPPGNPDIMESLESVASLLKALNRPAEAGELFDRIGQKIAGALQKVRATEQDTLATARSLIALGTVLQSAHRYDEAEKYYREALAVRRKLIPEDDPQVIALLGRLTDMLTTAGKAALAQAAWQESLDIRVRRLGSSDNRERRGDIYILTGGAIATAKQVEFAGVICREGMAMEPNDVNGLGRVAWQLATSADPASQDPKLAIELATRAVKLDPSDPDAAKALGVAYYRNGDFPQCVTWLEKAVTLAAETPQLANFLFLAMANQRLGNHAAALRWYDTAEQKNLEDTSSKELLQFRTEARALIFPSTTSTSHPTTAR